MRVESTEYIKVPVTGPDADSLTASQLAMSVTPAGAPADWHSVDGYSDGEARLLVGPESTVGALTPGINRVYVRVTDNPEIPVVLAGSLVVEA